MNKSFWTQKSEFIDNSKSSTRSLVLSYRILLNSEEENCSGCILGHKALGSCVYRRMGEFGSLAMWSLLSGGGIQMTCHQNAPIA